MISQFEAQEGRRPNRSQLNWIDRDSRKSALWAAREAGQWELYADSYYIWTDGMLVCVCLRPDDPTETAESEAKIAEWGAALWARSDHEEHGPRYRRELELLLHRYTVPH